MNYILYLCHPIFEGKMHVSHLSHLHPFIISLLHCFIGSNLVSGLQPTLLLSLNTPHSHASLLPQPPLVIHSCKRIRF